MLPDFVFPALRKRRKDARRREIINRELTILSEITDSFFSADRNAILFFSATGTTLVARLRISCILRCKKKKKRRDSYK